MLLKANIRAFFKKPENESKNYHQKTCHKIKKGNANKKKHSPDN